MLTYQPYVAGSVTSEEAAKTTDAVTWEARVYSFIRSRGTFGATDDEVEAHLDISHQTASARRRGLELRGHVQRTSVTRPTRYGRAAGVYVVTVLSVEQVQLSDDLRAFHGIDLPSDAIVKKRRPSKAVVDKAVEEIQAGLLLADVALDWKAAPEIAQLLEWLKP